MNVMDGLSDGADLDGVYAMAPGSLSLFPEDDERPSVLNRVSEYGGRGRGRGRTSSVA